MSNYHFLQSYSSKATSAAGFFTKFFFKTRQIRFGSGIPQTLLLSPGKRMAFLIKIIKLLSFFILVPFLLHVWVFPAYLLTILLGLALSTSCIILFLRTHTYDTRLEEKEKNIELLNITIRELNKALAEKELALADTTHHLQATVQDAAMQNMKIEYQNEFLTDMNKDLVAAKEVIEEKNKQLEIYNQSLEQHVEQRTLLLKKTNEELITTNQELDTFVYRASHDLLGPVASLLGLYSIAKTQSCSEIAGSYLEHFGKTADKMHKKLLSLLEVMSIKEKPVEIKKVDVKILLDQILCDLNSMDNFDKISFRLDIESNLVHLLSDAFLLKIILKNLLMNAVAFSKANNPAESLSEFYVTTEVFSLDTNNIGIRIRDNGVGIEEEVAGKIFNMFYKGSFQSKGAGLGLYIAQKAAGKLQGKINYTKDTTGNETVFTLILPILPENVLQIHPATVTKEEPSASYLPKAIHRMSCGRPVYTSAKDKAYIKR